MEVEYLYPNSNLSLQQLEDYGGDGYQCIDDPYNSPDNDSSYLYSLNNYGGYWYRSDFGLTNLAIENAVITKITVYMRVRIYNTDASVFSTTMMPHLYLRNEGGDSIDVFGEYYDGRTSYHTESKEYTTNPITGKAWTVNELNNIYISLSIFDHSPYMGEDTTPRVTQIYIKVEYKKPPTVTTTTPVTTKDHESAILEGEVTDADGQSITERGFEYKKGVDGEVSTVSEKDDDFGIGTFELEVTGLEPNTEYYYRVYAINEAGTGYGDWVSFTTDKTTPTVVTNEATEVDKDKFKANGNITATGGENCTIRGFEYGLTPVATWDAHDEGSYEAGAFNKVITGLQANTIYYFRAYATNSVGTTYGSWLQVVTASAGTTPSGTKISLVGDYSGYVDKLHASEQDLGANYKGYFVLTTDFAEGQSLAVYKRLLYLVNYFRKETSGEVKISVKCDNETDWREIGTVDLTGDEDILMQEMGVDELGKHFLIKFEGENAFRYLGTIFWYLVQGVR